MKIISVDFYSSISEIEIDNIENFIKLNKLIKIYYWEFNKKYINCYVNIEENILRNTHILPSNGISDIVDIESNEIEIENTIYMIAISNSVYCDLTLQEYGLFYFESTESSSSNSSSDEEIEKENEIIIEMKDVNEKLKNIKLDNICDTLDIDMNIY